MNKLKVCFMGSGDIAVPSLAALAESDRIDLRGVCTQPDKPAGRKKRLTPTPVGLWCAENSVAVVKPPSVNAPEFLAKLADMDLDFVFVVSFGQILKPALLETPRMACVNLHASLLPRHRGASPIVSAILAGDPEVGVTFMKMDEGLDTGPEYAKFAYSPKDERADELEAVLGRIGADHVVDVLADTASGALRPVPQNDSEATYSGKTAKSDALIDWRESADMITRRVRAYHPWPGAHFFIETPKRRIKLAVTSAAPAAAVDGFEPGETIMADKHEWIIACGEGALSLRTVKPEGKKEMTAAEFLRGQPHLRSVA